MSTPDLSTAADTIARECIAVRLRRLNRVVTNLYDDALRPFDLRVGQANLLVMAAKLGLAHPADVCRLLQMDPSTLSRNVERMRAKGWLEIVAADDARAAPFRLTPAGKKLLRQVFPAWKKAQGKASELLGADGVALLDRASARIKSASTKA